MNVVTHSKKSIFDRMEREVVEKKLQLIRNRCVCSLIKFVDVVGRVGGMECRRIGTYDVTI